jgi:hypothetical protein
MIGAKNGVESVRELLSSETDVTVDLDVLGRLFDSLGKPSLEAIQKLVEEKLSER